MLLTSSEVQPFPKLPAKSLQRQECSPLYAELGIVLCLRIDCKRDTCLIKNLNYAVGVHFLMPRLSCWFLTYHNR